MQDEKEMIYSLGGASKATGFARQTLRKLIESGSLEATKIRVPWGGKFKTEYNIRAKELEPFINENRINQLPVKNNYVLERLDKLEKQVEVIIKKLNLE